MPASSELLRRAEGYLQERQLEEAAGLYQEIHAADPQAPEGALGAAQIGLLLQEYDETRWLLGQILERFPDSAVAWYLLGALEQASGNMEQSIEPLLQAIKLQPGFRDAYLVIAESLIQTGATATAERALRDADHRFPGDAEILQRLADLAEVYGDTDLAEYYLESVTPS